MIIQFVRHMETDMNRLGIIQGSSDGLLGEIGQAQSRLFVEEKDLSDIDVVYCSNLSRAKFLAGLIKDKIHKELIIDERLNEIHVGQWEGKTWKEVTVEYKDFLEGWFKDNTNIPAPDGESYAELAIRLHAFIEDIKKLDYKKVMVIAHGAVIKTLICSMLDIDLKNRSKFVIDNGSITEFIFSKNKVVVSKINSK